LTVQKLDRRQINAFHDLQPSEKSAQNTSVVTATPTKPTFPSP